MIDSKLVVVIRGDHAKMAEKIASSCVDEGVKVLEVTFTVPKADQLVEKLKNKYEDVTIGTGTVLDSETARIAILSGADFIVSPWFSVEIAKLCNWYDIPYLPGCMIVNEILKAIEYGVTVVKIYPGSVFSPSYIKNTQGPLPHINIMPTGGRIANIHAWFNVGAAMTGVEGQITNPAQEGKYSEVTKMATTFQSTVNRM